MPFIDDYSRMSFVYFLRSKGQALEMFLQFLEMAERQTGLKLKKLRTDEGGELTSHAFQEQCTARGIVRQITAPYSSIMNSVAEIRHQLLQYQARTMLLQAGLSIGYWAEAVNTANYILNLLPSSSVNGHTPYELWTGRKPSLRPLRVFGSPAYMHIPTAKQTSKFAARSEKLVLVGYMEDLKAYKLLHPQTHKAYYSRSVIVHEGVVLGIAAGPAVRPDVEITTESHEGELSLYEDTSFDDQKAATTVKSEPHISIVPDPTPDSVGATEPALPLASQSDLSQLGLAPAMPDSEDLFDRVRVSETSANSPPPTRQLRPRGAGRGSWKVQPYSLEDFQFSKRSTSQAVVPTSAVPPSAPMQNQSEHQSESNSEESSSHTPEHLSLGELLAAARPSSEPVTFQEAIRGSEGEKWQAAAQDECDSLIRNKTWVLEDLPKGLKAIEGKWIFKKKLQADGTIDRYKARYVIRGFRQMPGVDYLENKLFLPVVRIPTLRYLFALAAELDLELEHLDICTAFLNGDLNETVYIRQPKVFVDKQNPEKVWQASKVPVWT